MPEKINSPRGSPVIGILKFGSLRVKKLKIINFMNEISQGAARVAQSRGPDF